MGLTNRSNKKFGGKENLVGIFENTERDGIDIRSYLSIALGFLILTIPGFFVSILTEFARQLLFFQLMIFFVGVIASTNKSNKKYLKANS